MIDTHSSKGAVCPHCEYLHVPEDREMWELYDPDTCGITCVNCGKEMELTVHCSYSWSTEKVDEEENA